MGSVATALLLHAGEQLLCRSSIVLHGGPSTSWASKYSGLSEAGMQQHCRGRGRRPYKLVVQDDRNVVLYGNNVPLWHTNTGGQ